MASPLLGAAPGCSCRVGLECEQDNKHVSVLPFAMNLILILLPGHQLSVKAQIYLIDTHVAPNLFRVYGALERVWSETIGINYTARYAITWTVRGGTLAVLCGATFPLSFALSHGFRSAQESFDSKYTIFFGGVQYTSNRPVSLCLAV